MTLTEVVQKPSVIGFEDKSMMPNSLGILIPDREEIRHEIPELDLGERIVLNAWGSWEVHHYENYRRRLGIYLVTSKEVVTSRRGEENLHYVLKKEREFSESEIVHSVLSGNFAQVAEMTEGLKYIVLGRYGRSLP